MHDVYAGVKAKLHEMEASIEISKIIAEPLKNGQISRGHNNSVSYLVKLKKVL